MSKTAFITGITGQDGSYLSKFLLEKGYTVHGLVRWDSTDGTEKLAAFKDQIHLHHGDLTDANNITTLVKQIQPDEIYNLAALSHVGTSFKTPASVLDIITKGTLNILEAVRLCELEHKTRIYQASSSEMFGSTPPPQSEYSPMQPCSPYGVAKLAAYHLAKIYSESYDMFVSNGILFNHESPVRGQDFVTRKITRAVAAIEVGEENCITLGNLNARRDWGHAMDYVRGMWMTLQQGKPDDFVLASGENYSVREFVERAFDVIGITIEWKGTGEEEIGTDAKNGEVLVKIDPALYRPKEVDALLGDASRARTILGWQPEITFDELIADMINADRAMARGKTWRMAS